MLGRLSLRLKLTLGYALIFAVTVLLGAVGVYFASRVILTRSLDTTLIETASVARASIEDQNGVARFTSELRPSGDLLIELLAADGRRLDVAGQAEDARALPLTAGFASVDERRILTTALPGNLLLRVSRPSDTLTRLLETLAHILAGGTLSVIVLACGAGYWLADRALRPVDAVARTAGLIARRGSYRDRVPQASGHDEMARLTGTVNGMLDRLENTIEREKDFARTAAHELRTPLTTLRGRLDLALDKPRDAQGYRTALESMRGRVQDLERLTEGLLALARSEGVARLTRVELAGVALEAAEDVRDQAAEAGKRLELDVEETWVLAEPAGVRQAVTNLLVNALKYGGNVVILRVGAGEIGVLDGGTGPARNDWPRLTRPFERGAGTQNVPGSGLGLALVTGLAARWNAAVVPEWGEASFAVWLRFGARA